MKKSIAFLIAIVLLSGFSTKAFSWGDHYRYRGGHYYRDAGWLGFGGFVTGLAVGAYVASLPPRYETVVVGGVPYYYADGYYYEAGPNGYVIVEPPVVVQGQMAGPPPNSMVYILGILVGILLIACIILFLKKIVT